MREAGEKYGGIGLPVWLVYWYHFPDMLKWLLATLLQMVLEQRSLRLDVGYKLVAESSSGIVSRIGKALQRAVSVYVIEKKSPE